LVEQMRRRGILVRDRNSDPGCAGCVRITLGNRGQTGRLLRELPEALAAIGFTPQPRPTPASSSEATSLESPAEAARKEAQ
jgi:hypothetical protein